MADYRVTGTLSPDATGDYTQNGTHNGEPAYERDGDGAYWIWSDGGGNWYISAGKGALPSCWYRTGDIAGEYAPVIYTGTATVVSPTTGYLPLCTAGGYLVLST